MDIIARLLAVQQSIAGICASGALPEQDAKALRAILYTIPGVIGRLERLESVGVKIVCGYLIELSPAMPPQYRP